MRCHLLSPEQHLLRNYYAEVNKLAWSLRRVTGGALRLAMQMKVPPGMRDDVMERVKFIQKRHGIKEEH
jgi:hypothetical protein